MWQLSMSARDSHLCLTVYRPAVTAAWEELQAGVWCYLNVIVLTWHIACGAELWCALSCCAMSNRAALWARHKCEGVTGELWTLATSSGSTKTSSDGWNTARRGLCVAVQAVLLCASEVCDSLRRTAAHETLKQRTSVKRERWRGDNRRAADVIKLQENLTSWEKKEKVFN